MITLDCAQTDNVTQVKDLLPTSCTLCPRACGVNRAAGQRGYCGATDTLVIARSALHFWEEPPISGEKGSGTIFFSYCPLRCSYCQNSVIAKGLVGKEVPFERLVDMCLELQEQGALNINFVTPTHYTTVIIEAVKQARSRGLRLPIVWNTSGYETRETIESLEGTVDVYLTDFKYADECLARCYSQAPDYPAMAIEALDAMVAQVGKPRYDTFHHQHRLTRGVVVRHLILPQALDASKAALELLFSRYGNTVLYSIMNQYTPILPLIAAQEGMFACVDERDAAWASRVLAKHPELASHVPDGEYEELLEFADTLGIEDYFWQTGQADKDSFIPLFDNTGV